MNVQQRDFLVMVTLAAAAATPAWGQDAAPAVGPVSSNTQSAAAIPDFSRIWYHPSFPWFEPPASGPGPVTNRSRWPQRPDDAGGSLALPPTKDGVSDFDQLVGDYTNPILQPWAAEVVKKFGEISLAGITYPNPPNQCWPEPMPFISRCPKVPAAPLGQQVLPARAAASAMRARRGARGSPLWTTGTASRRAPKPRPLTPAQPRDPMIVSTRATVRDRRNAVRDASERCPPSIGTLPAGLAGAQKLGDFLDCEAHYAAAVACRVLGRTPGQAIGFQRNISERSG